MFESWLGEFVSSLLGAFAMGTSCGAGCSPVIGMFLTTYVFETQSDTKKTLKAFFKFFAGKAISVICVCVIACITGKMFLSDKGYFMQYKMDFIMPIFLIIMGIYMIVKRIKEKVFLKKCLECKKCKSDKLGNNATLIGGFLYGITPCAPLIFLAGCALTLPLYKAIILALVFSVACCLSPLIIIMAFAKLIMENMKEEVPKMLSYVQDVFSIMLVIVGSFYLVKCFL